MLGTFPLKFSDNVSFPNKVLLASFIVEQVEIVFEEGSNFLTSFNKRVPKILKFSISAQSFTM